MAKELSLSSWIDFGKYRSAPKRLEKIIETPDGRRWMRWMATNAVLFKFDSRALNKLEELEEKERNGRILQ